MTTLVCQVIGSRNDCVELEVDEAVRVAKLKELIKRKIDFPFPATKLELYLAKKHNHERRGEDGTDQVPQAKKQNEWLSEHDISVLTQKNVSSETLEMYLQEDLFMKPFQTLGRYFGDANGLKSVPVHVLVQLPPLSCELIPIPVAQDYHEPEQWWQQRLHTLLVNIEQYTRYKTRETKALYQRIWKWVAKKACECWQCVTNGVHWFLEYFNNHVVSLYTGPPEYAPECSSV